MTELDDVIGLRIVTRRTFALGLALTAAVAALAGCGGSSSSTTTTQTNTTTTTTTTNTTTTTTAGGTHARLTSAQWTTYQSANKAFVSVNSKGIAKFRSCNQASRAASPSNSANVFKTCLGDTVAKVSDATHSFGVTLHGFQPTVSGNCTQSLNTYIGSLVSWTNVINGINHAVQNGQLPSTANAQTVYDQITSSANAFAKACRPV
jgi:hypothetical protein